MSANASAPLKSHTFTLVRLRAFFQALFDVDWLAWQLALHVGIFLKISSLKSAVGDTGRLEELVGGSIEVTHGGDTKKLNANHQNDERDEDIVSDSCVQVDLGVHF